MKRHLALALSLFALTPWAAPVTQSLTDADIDLAINLADTHPGTFSLLGDCAKNELALTKTVNTYSYSSTWTLSTPSQDYSLTEDDAKALDAMFSRLQVPEVDTGCGVKFSRATIVGSGCGDQAQQWSVQFEAL